MDPSILLNEQKDTISSLLIRSYGHGLVECGRPLSPFVTVQNDHFIICIKPNAHWCLFLAVQRGAGGVNVHWGILKALLENQGYRSVVLIIVSA